MPSGPKLQTRLQRSSTVSTPAAATPILSGYPHWREARSAVPLPAQLPPTVQQPPPRRRISAAASAGDVTGTQGATVVSAVGGRASANVASGVDLALGATSANTANQIVKRDASGNFSAGTITAIFSGNVTGNVSGTAANVTGTVLQTNGGAGSTTGSITGPGALTFTAASGTNATLTTSGTGNVVLNPSAPARGCLLKENNQRGGPDRRDRRGEQDLCRCRRLAVPNRQ